MHFLIVLADVHAFSLEYDLRCNIICKCVAPHLETEEKMLRRLSEWLYRVVNGWVVLIGLLIFIVFIALLATGQFDGGGEFPEDAGVPDLSL